MGLAVPSSVAASAAGDEGAEGDAEASPPSTVASMRQVNLPVVP